MPESDQPPDLDALRRDIDRIDAAMLALLVERGRIVTGVAAHKRAGEGGLAFRPGREAVLMRALGARDPGPWRAGTVQGLWRAILGASVHLQTPYALHLDAEGGEGEAREAARFHFGFSAPLVLHRGPEAVVEAVAGDPAGIGLVGAGRGLGAAWWRGLEGEGRPKIAARLPFAEPADHPATPRPASSPLYVILAQAPADPTELRLVSVRVEAVRPTLEIAFAFHAASREAGAVTQSLHREGPRGVSLLMALPPGEAAEARLRGALARLGPAPATGATLAMGTAPVLREVGGHARRMALDAGPERVDALTGDRP